MSRFIIVLGAGLFLFSATAPTGLGRAVFAAESSKPGDELADKVATRINAEAELKSYSVKVSSSNGAITLEGVVPTVIARAQVGDIAVKTDGVKKVNNKLKIG